MTNADLASFQRTQAEQIRSALERLRVIAEELEQFELTARTTLGDFFDRDPFGCDDKPLWQLYGEAREGVLGGVVNLDLIVGRLVGGVENIDYGG